MSRLAPALSLCSLLLLSCATVPPSETAFQWFGVLPPPSADSLYLSVDVASAWDLLRTFAESNGSDTGELERIVPNLNRVHVRVRLSPGRSPDQSPPPPEFSLIALGKFTPGSVACRLNRDPSWERVMLERLPGGGSTSANRSYRTYWRRQELEIAAPKRSVLLVAGGDPTAAATLLRRLDFPGANPLPAQVSAAPETADIFLYVPDPAALAASTGSAAQDPGALLQKLPIRQAWIIANRLDSPETDDAYELEAVFLLSEVDNPRSVEMLLRLMLTLWLRTARVQNSVEKLRAVTIRSDSESARIESLFLSAGEIASFIQTLLPEGLGSGGLL